MISVQLHSPRQSTATTALATSLIVASRRVFTISVSNNSASARFIQLFDASAVPADAAVPFTELRLAANTTGQIQFNQGRMMNVGLVVVSSSTQAAKTLSGAADILVDVTHD